MVKKDAMERFWDKADKSGDCWLWTGYIQPNRNGIGYGRFWDGTRLPSGSPKYVTAHRFAYERLIGPIPDGLLIDHKCINTLCVNPAHLEPVSNKRNLERQRISSRNTSGFRGVYWSKREQKWVASVVHDGEKIYGGCWATSEQANEAAIRLRQRLYGQDAEREVRLEST